jgi:LTXXQ motif family protein
MSAVRKRSIAIPLALAGFLFAVEAAAQLGGGFPGGGMGGGTGSGRSRGGASRERPQQQQTQATSPETGANMLEQTIEELRIDLKLLPTQVPAWEAYVGKARLLAGDITRDKALVTATTQVSALKLIDRSVDGARNRLAALEEIADAAKAFYALLTPEQQALADPRLASLVPARNGAYAPFVPRAAPASPRSSTGY